MVFKTIESFKLIPWVMNIVGNQLISVYCTTGNGANLLI
ncbi:hypothetical protein EC2731150_2065 [Escherichia coli 2731150]|nr:hypothetical protein EC2731150_2065 [Escherichia coli 2731150]